MVFGACYNVHVLQRKFIAEKSKINKLYVLNRECKSKYSVHQRSCKYCQAGTRHGGLFRKAEAERSKFKPTLGNLLTLHFNEKWLGIYLKIVDPGFGL